MNGAHMTAVVPVRDGVLPLGADEAVAEAGGVAMVVGSKAEVAASGLRTATSVLVAEVGAFAPAAWAAALAPRLSNYAVVILAGSADGRDLAPRLAHVLRRPLLTGAIAVGSDRVTVVRWGGLVAEEHAVTGPVLVTLVPGVRGFEAVSSPAHVEPIDVTLTFGTADAEVLEVLGPDPATVDLAEAERVVAGGAGLGGPQPFELLRRVGVALGASYGASRVAADAGWVPQDRFIGTTGVTVNPRLYIAFGISGAVQHVTGLGQPDHIVAVNVDGSAPMMGMADLAIVTDAPALLRQLADRLGVEQ
jgi:electron transfer flavoprotein alpha subunit